MEYQKHYLYPGAILASSTPHKVTTVLGTCVAVCLWDEALKIGGINHYLLPLWNGEGLASPRYGNIAIDKLVERMVENGSMIQNLKAKVFGGKSDSESIYNIGQRNIDFAEKYLSELRIPIVGKSLGGDKGRKILYSTDTGEVLMKYLNV